MGVKEKMMKDDHDIGWGGKAKNNNFQQKWWKIHVMIPKSSKKILKKFSDPLTRQVDEGLRIYQTNPELILNSKSEANHPKIMWISLEGST